MKNYIIRYNNRNYEIEINYILFYLKTNNAKILYFHYFKIILKSNKIDNRRHVN